MVFPNLGVIVQSIFHHYISIRSCDWDKVRMLTQARRAKGISKVLSIQAPRGPATFDLGGDHGDEASLYYFQMVPWPVQGQFLLRLVSSLVVLDSCEPQALGLVLRSCLYLLLSPFCLHLLYTSWMVPL